MIRTALSRGQTVRRITILLAATAAVGGRAPGQSAAPSSAGPKIATARIGFNNHYKLGFWTAVHVDVAHADAIKSGRIDVTVADSDGVATTASGPLGPPTAAGGQPTATVYTQVGRVGSPIRISLLDGDQTLDELTLDPNGKPGQAAAIVPVAATSELIVSLGAVGKNGLRDAFQDRPYSASQAGRQLVELDSIADLPVDWFGYEGVDVLVMNVGDGKWCRELAKDGAKYAALQKWVELGGRLVLMCGGENAPMMLGDGAPLAALVPGKFADVVRMNDAGPLEHFASSTAPIALAPGASIQVPHLTNVNGVIEVYGGRKPSDLPLVVRTARGFGEIAFVGVETSQPPLATWSARTAFLRALLQPYLTEVTTSDASQQLVTRGYNDLSGALRQQLGRSFPSVVPIGFPVITGLAIAYLLFLGPLDYLVINRWLRRPLLAWVSFPLVVIVFSVLAVAIASWSKGSASTRVNRLTLIDVDTISGQARGTFWAALYSPEAEQFDLAVQLPQATTGAAHTSDLLFSWWGLPGIGIGGMQTGGDLGIVRSGYRYGADRRSLEQVPVLASATKSLLARWAGNVPAKIEAELTDADGLVMGSIVNQTGGVLRNVRLFYGSWAYRLGTLNAGERIEIGEELSPRQAKTIATRDAFGESGAAPSAVEGRVFAADQATPKDILSLMMFYQTAGGFGFAHLPNCYQAYCDLSRQLSLGRAVFVANAGEPGAELVDNSSRQTVGEGEKGGSALVYRFVLPVARKASP